MLNLLNHIGAYAENVVCECLSRFAKVALAERINHPLMFRNDFVTSDNKAPVKRSQPVEPSA
jgi:hypothetical protein